VFLLTASATFGPHLQAAIIQPLTYSILIGQGCTDYLTCPTITGDIVFLGNSIIDTDLYFGDNFNGQSGEDAQTINFNPNTLTISDSSNFSVTITAAPDPSNPQFFITGCVATDPNCQTDSQTPLLVGVGTLEPEPGTWLTGLTGAVAVLFFLRFRRKPARQPRS
jgi:hypothetical protein